MAVQPFGCEGQHATSLQRQALINRSNLSMMLVTREDLQTILENTMSLEDLLKGDRVLTPAHQCISHGVSVRPDMHMQIRLQGPHIMPRCLFSIGLLCG